MNYLPPFYYPTTIVTIDDDPFFNNSVIESLKEDGYSILTFENSHEALTFIENNVTIIANENFIQGSVEHEYYDTPNHIPVDFDLEYIIKLSENANKYKEIGVLIVDYDMPHMNGINLCERLKDLLIKKILLTGNLGHPQAVNAFNNKLINCYIGKDETKTLVDDLKRHINRLENEFFLDTTVNLRKTLELGGLVTLSESNFIDFFNKFCQENNIKEYYLVDKNGSFLLINEKKEKFYLIIHTDESLNKFIIPYQDDESIVNYISAINNKEKIPFFGLSSPDSLKSSSDWEKYLHNPEILEGDKRYYWKCIPENMFFNK